MKVCSDCGENKPLEQFFKDKRTSSGRGYLCVDCKNSRNRQWRANNLEKARLCSRESKRKLYDPVKRRLEYLREDPIKRKESWKRSKLANREKVIAAAAQRKKRIKSRTPLWLTKQERSEIFNFYCWCHIISSVSETKMHVDHVIPLQGKTVSGLHVPWNLRIITAKENHNKSNKLITHREHHGKH